MKYSESLDVAVAIFQLMSATILVYSIFSNSWELISKSENIDLNVCMVRDGLKFLWDVVWCVSVQFYVVYCATLRMFLLYNIFHRCVYHNCRKRHFCCTDVHNIVTYSTSNLLNKMALYRCVFVFIFGNGNVTTILGCHINNES